MRQLHVLGVSDDGQALLLGPSAGKASHRLSLDDKLRAAVRGQLSAAGVERAESALTPKEIQSRMREGATAEEVAKEAQVPVARVLPYAAPVIAERERIVEQARAAVLHRARGASGLRPLGEVVDAHLGETAGLKADTVEWSARRRRDGAWVVLLSYAARGGRRAASWLWRPVERDLTALDPSASRLAVEESASPRRKAAPKRAAASRPAKRAAGTRATKKAARRPAAKKAAKAAPATKGKPAAKRSTSARPVSKKAPTRAAPAKKAVTRRAPVTRAAARAVVKRAAAAKAPVVNKAPTRKPAAVKKLAAVKPERPAAARKVRRPAEDTVTVRPTVVPDPVVTEVPSPVVVIPRPQPEPEPEPQPIVARRPGQRVPLPSWSDVLLGVAPPEATRDAPARRRRKSG